MDRKYNKGLNIEMNMSVRKDKKRHIPKVEYKETKNDPHSNNDKISVILIDDIIDKPISNFTEKIKDNNVFSLGKRLSLKAYKRLYY